MKTGLVLLQKMIGLVVVVVVAAGEGVGENGEGKEGGCGKKETVGRQVGRPSVLRHSREKDTLEFKVKNACSGRQGGTNGKRVERLKCTSL